MNIQENVRKIRAELDEINSSARIVAATKTRTLDEIRQCMETGLCLAAGENRVQELTAKYTPEFRWDFIGQLQTNKVKYVVGKAELIHGFDRIALAEALQKECEKKNTRQKVLVEINTGEEENKGGIFLGDLDRFLDETSAFDRIEVVGLMAVAPVFYSEDMLKKAFTDTYEAFFRRKSDVFKELSMGMSGDYKIAAACGATIVRPGTAIFGARSYQQL